MRSFQPHEVKKDGIARCGLTVTVGVIGEQVGVIETELDRSEFARAVSDGEGVHVPVQARSVTYTRVTEVVSSLACKQCGLCEVDYSATLQTARYVPNNELGEVETACAEAVMTISMARQAATQCVAEM